eukprot:TRINITY_DN48328_c0_g1_i1.p2 TRINITY_DN48328_c0_g1~~TRINITY_DN48328_c0_g1_i1.p2  ORF type:complete len:156 (-),score=18.55 TRINITY_DN48328_c0_g1_i1:102-569(-)
MSRSRTTLTNFSEVLRRKHMWFLNGAGVRWRRGFDLQLPHRARVSDCIVDKPAVTTDASALPLAFPDDVDSLFRKGGKERPFAAGSLVVQSRSAASKRITAAHKAAGDVAALAPPVGPKASRCGPTNCALPLRNGAWLWRSVGVGRSDEDEDTLV